MTDIDAWTTRDTAIAASCFILALVLRLIFLDQVWHIPFFENPIVDGYSYDQWAQRIAAGDWLGDEVFYQAPAYPYFLGSIYRIFGRDLFAAHAIQMGLGALSCVLVFAATRNLFGRVAGTVAGFGLAFYGPALFFDSLLQKAGLAQALTAALLLGIVLFQNRPRSWSALAVGAVLALLCLTRENALVFAPLLPLWMLLRFSERPIAERIRWSLAFAAGLGSLLLAVGLRNQIVGDSFVMTTSQMGSNFYIGNNEEATGLYEPLLPGRQTPRFEGSDAKLLAEKDLGRRLTRGQVSDYWMSKSFEFIAREPARFAALVASKTLMTTNRFEIPDTEDIYVYAEESSLLRVLGNLHFGVVFPLAVAGMVFAGRDRKVWILYGLLSSFAASLILFYVMARYRFPLVALLLPFCGLAVSRALDAIRLRDFERLAAPAAVAFLVAALANIEVLPEAGFRSGAYTNLGNIMLEQEKNEEAEVYLEKALALSPANTDALLHMAILRRRQGRLNQAEALLRQMLVLEPDDPRAHRALVPVLRRLGRPEEAERHRYSGWRKRAGEVPSREILPQGDEAALE